MRNVVLLSACLLLVSACAGLDDYSGYHDNDDNGGYGGYGGNNGYGNYYPYGNPNYPRNNIYYIDGYHACNGYVYQGYCYKDKDDVQAAIYWDHQHGRDDNWHKKRKDWCNQHDCRREHEVRNEDRNEEWNSHEDRRQPVEHDRAAYPHLQKSGESRNDDQRHHEYQQPVNRSSDNIRVLPGSGGAHERQNNSHPNNSSWQPPVEVRQQNNHQREYSAPAVEPVQRARPANTNNGSGSSRERQSGRNHDRGGSNVSASPE